MSRQDEIVLAFKPSEKQWTYLEPVSKRTRSAWVRQAVQACVEKHPVLTSIPLHEPPDEPIRHQPIRFVATTEITAWLDQLPTQMRSYMIRCAINWFRAKQEATEGPQQVFNLEAAAPQSTGTDI